MKIAILLALIFLSGVAYAGQGGAFLCKSAQPYDYAEVGADFESARLVLEGRSPTSIALPGLVTPGQSIKRRSATGLALAPVTTPEQGDVVAILHGTKVVAQVPGVLSDWDISDAAGGLAYFAAFPYAEGLDAAVTDATQYVVDTEGKIITARPVKRQPNEGSDPGLRFTEDGKGLFLPPGEEGSRNLYVLDPFTLDASVSIELPEGLKATSMAMSTATSGYIIAGGRVFFLDEGRLQATPLAQRDFKARDVVMDARSGVAVVNGIGEFVVLDLAGRTVHSQKMESRYPVLTDARLAIDGSVGYTDLATGDRMLKTRGSGYREAMKLDIAKEDWGQVQCFTENSAALMVDGKPKVIKF